MHELVEENPNNHAGTPTKTASSNHRGSSLSIAGSSPKNAVITVSENTIQSVDVGGISRGGESLIKWCEKLVGTE